MGAGGGVLTLLKVFPGPRGPPDVQKTIHKPGQIVFWYPAFDFSWVLEVSLTGFFWCRGVASSLVAPTQARPDSTEPIVPHKVEALESYSRGR